MIDEKLDIFIIIYFYNILTYIEEKSYSDFI